MQYLKSLESDLKAVWNALKYLKPLQTFEPEPAEFIYWLHYILHCKQCLPYLCRHSKIRRKDLKLLRMASKCFNTAFTCPALCNNSLTFTWNRNSDTPRKSKDDTFINLKIRFKKVTRWFVCKYDLFNFSGRSWGFRIYLSFGAFVDMIKY